MADQNVPEQSSARARFPPFVFDLTTGELTKDGRPVKLDPQPAKVLALLVSRPGKVVTREEIQAAVWGEDTHVDFDLGLNSCVRQIRAALGDDADEPRYVDTVPRIGYRFVAEVQRHPPDVGRGRERERILPLALASLSLLALAAIVLWRVFAPPDDGSASATTIAVLPFTVHGPDALEYLEAGMVDLLGMTLDGAGELRTVDGRAVLRAATEESGPLSPELGAGIAEELGAGLFVLGGVVATGDELRMSASLFDLEAHELASATALAEGEARIPDAVDALSLELVSTQLEGAERASLRSAARATPSFGAMKAYLAGEALYRERKRADAMASFREAIDQDEEFALAWFHLARASRWPEPTPLTLKAIQQAIDLESKLSPMERSRVRAWRAEYIEQDFVEAEELLRRITSQRPEDVDAWLDLGRHLMFNNWKRGRSIREARGPLESAVRLEPDHPDGLLWLAWVSSYEGRYEDAVDLRIRRSGFEGTREQYCAKPRPGCAPYVAAAATPNADGAFLDALSQEPDRRLVNSISAVSNWNRDFDAAARLARVLTESSRSKQIRAFGHGHLGLLAAARGRWQEARQHFERGSELDEAMTLPLHAWAAAAPFLTVSTKELEEIYETLVGWKAAAVPPNDHSYALIRTLDGTHAVVRTYLLGRLAARLGHADEAEEHAAALAAWATDSELSSTPNDLAHGIRARMLSREAALAQFDAAEFRWRPSHMISPSLFQTAERFERAELLMELGRDQEALGWLDSFAWSVSHEYFVLPWIELRKGEIFERRGEIEDAIRHYERFLNFLSSCDPELAGQVENVAERVERLRKEV